MFHLKRGWPVDHSFLLHMWIDGLTCKPETPHEQVRTEEAFDEWWNVFKTPLKNRQKTKPICQSCTDLSGCAPTKWTKLLNCLIFQSTWYQFAARWAVCKLFGCVKSWASQKKPDAKRLHHQLTILFRCDLEMISAPLFSCTVSFCFSLCKDLLLLVQSNWMTNNIKKP